MYTIKMTWIETSDGAINTVETAYYVGENVFSFVKEEATTMRMKHALRIARTLAANSKITAMFYAVKLTKVRVVRA